MDIDGMISTFMLSNLKNDEERKRRSKWKKGDRWRLIQEAIDWAGRQSGASRNVKKHRLAEQDRKLQRMQHFGH